MKHLFAPLACLLLAGAAGCADPSRMDALETNLARVRAEASLRDREIAWLHWGQTVLGARSAPASGADEREALVKRIAALEAENTALLDRLERAERRLGTLSDKGSAPRSSPAPPSAAPARPAHTRTLDERVPYELAVRRVDDGPSLPAAPEGRHRPARRTLDERVPY